MKRKLHGCLEIKNFSSCVEKILHLLAALTCKIFFQPLKGNFVSLGSHVISCLQQRTVNMSVTDSSSDDDCGRINHSGNIILTIIFKLKQIYILYTSTDW